MTITINKQNSNGTAPVPPIFEPALLQDYLNKLLSLLLRAEENDLKNTLWNFPETLEKLGKFANDPQVNAIYITKEKIENKDQNDQAISYSYTLSQNLAYYSNHVASVVIIKHIPNLDPIMPIQTQVQILSLPGPAPSESGSVAVNPYDAIHSYIHLAVAPYFDAYVDNAKDTSTIGKKYDDSKMGIPMTKKKIAELELCLLHLQEKVAIPKTLLNIHPIVQKIVEKCKQEGTRITVNAIDPQLLNESTFLNELQAGVNDWVKEIQKVTKLTRDHSSETAAQEINFWLSMEAALDGINNNLENDQIVLTLDILRSGKRFHATVSFMADTGLKEATETDFPLNELLSAPGISEIKEAIILIFGHFSRKLKLSPYPIKKALPLAEAISRDLNEQLLKVLGNRRLMYMGYEEFEKLVSGAEDVFKAWDECIKEFTNVARDVTRKRNDKFIPIKVILAHDKLQERINFVRAFRKKHEQLHQTVLKLMTQPKIVLKKIVVESEKDNDIDALEEIRLAYENVKDIDVLDVSPTGTEILMHAENAYNECVSRIESEIIPSLKDRLANDKDPDSLPIIFDGLQEYIQIPKPAMDMGIESKFEEIKKNFKNELNDIRNEIKDEIKDELKNELKNGLNEFKNEFKDLENKLEKKINKSNDELLNQIQNSAKLFAKISDIFSEMDNNNKNKNVK
ncbi:9986_t:CDS:2 [Entrophospora sp. SA101]|nr:9986_t:CDS:2 [Entrophospora sp. SA101]CAJ0843342.1 10901_t:CDS:2 [Entrophospora sp. SA101]